MFGDIGKGTLKDQVSKLLGEEDYKAIADLLNEQLAQQEKILELSDAEFEPVEKISYEKIQIAIENHDIDKALSSIISTVDQKQVNIQRQILRELDVDSETIKGEFP